jgi:hypothetical protein
MDICCNAIQLAVLLLEPIQKVQAPKSTIAESVLQIGKKWWCLDDSNFMNNHES